MERAVEHKRENQQDVCVCVCVPICKSCARGGGVESVKP